MATDICAECKVRELALCSTLSDVELVRLNAISRHRHLAKGATLMWAGEESVVCANVLSGVLKMTAAAADGREQIVGLLFPPDFVGQPQGGTMAFSVTALAETELCIVPRGPFQTLLNEHLKMARLLLRRTLTTLDDARARMLLLARGTAEEKLAGFLLEMADRALVGAPDAARDHPVTLQLPLSRGQIADVLGLTVETVSRQMTHLRTAGIIALPGGRALTVLDHSALKHRTILD